MATVPTSYTPLSGASPAKRVHTSAGATNMVASATGATLFSVTVANLSANARFVHILDARSLPSNGEHPILCFPLPANGAISFDTPTFFALGVVIAISNTAETLTISSDTALFTANLSN